MSGKATISQLGPDTGVRQNVTSLAEFRAAGLSKARNLLRDHITLVMCLPLEKMWDFFPTKYKLDEVRRHLVDKGLLVDGKWKGIHRDRLEKKQTGDTEYKIFEPVSDIFNQILAFVESNQQGDTAVRRMVHAGTMTPTSTRRSGGSRPDAFLEMASPCPNTAKGKQRVYRWRDITCPFEYKFGKGDSADNQDKLMWSLHHIMRSDVCRAFSFGVTIHGSDFRIWFSCRAGLITFFPFDWTEETMSLIHFFVILASSDETELGFDTNIKRISETSDFVLSFTVDKKVYNTSCLLYDIGADAPYSRGTWVFEVKDQEDQGIRVIKDCWVEDRPGKDAEHIIAGNIKQKMGEVTFNKYFVNIIGHRRTDPTGGFLRVCEMLKKERFGPEPRSLGCLCLYPLVPIEEKKSSYNQSAGNQISNQDRHLTPNLSGDPKKQKHTIHPRFRYQIIYEEKGESLYQVTSLADLIHHLAHVTLVLIILHKNGFIHRDLSPGNIILVGDYPKISDLEFAKARSADELEKLTRPGDPVSVIRQDMRTGTPLFLAVEVLHGTYCFLPPEKGPSKLTLNTSLISPMFQPEEMGEGTEVDQPTLEETESPSDVDQTSKPTHVKPSSRIFLHNPLHDFESVWWMAVWFVLSAKLVDVDDKGTQAQREVYKSIFSDRQSVLMIPHNFRMKCKPLTGPFEPLIDVLGDMAHELVETYKAYEESFDGNVIKPFGKSLAARLSLLWGTIVAQNANATLPVTKETLNRPKQSELDVEEGTEVLEGMGGGKEVHTGVAIEQDGAGDAGGDEDPFVETTNVTGKRVRAESVQVPRTRLKVQDS